jgi:DNA-binding GntR family transcriptional regulator
MTLERIEKASVQEIAYQKLRQAIKDGVFVAGQKLTNRELAASLGVSVTPIREAIRRLESEGAFEILPNGSVAIPNIDLTQAKDHFWLSRMLETQALRLSCPNLRAADISAIERIYEKAGQACESNESRLVAQLFHDFYWRIYSKCNSPTLLSFIDQLWLRAGPYHKVFHPKFDAQERGRHFREIIAALKTKNAEAAAQAFERFSRRLEDFLETELRRKQSAA